MTLGHDTLAMTHFHHQPLFKKHFKTHSLISKPKAGQQINSDSLRGHMTTFPNVAFLPRLPCPHSTLPEKIKPSRNS